MVIENVMYFALGLLAAGLLALIVLPAVWRRAVRLTKKRIEAATPMSMAEFRADKDQLRAEFALSTRRLEMNVEALRKRLAEQLREINRKKSDLSAVRGDRDNHLTIIRELEEREGGLRRRIVELEKESAELGLKLRMRDRELADRAGQLETAREAMRLPGRTSAPAKFDGRTLSGEYRRDVEELIAAVAIERRRIEQLEAQNKTLIAQLETAERRASEAFAIADELRRATSRQDEEAERTESELATAEARMIEAESRFSALLSETARMVGESDERAGQLLAEKLSLEEELARLRAKVAGVENTIMADWDTERVAQSQLRERLNDIASDVSRLVYAIEGRDPIEEDQSLYERVQRFAEGEPDRAAPHQRAAPRPLSPGTPRGGVVADRLAALRDIQSRG